jgi:hypothetical protein
MLNLNLIEDNSYMEKMLLAMWSFVHWQGDSTIFGRPFLIIALGIGTS